ncbi:MAG: hypothetical protein K2W96_06330, partial [Gemmataceae bacterium]|nr:hypothetical protein [Gemmataceae bacterium]
MVGLILLAEGDAAASTVHSGAMTALGYRVQHAEDGDEAMRLARALSPDLVVVGESVEGGAAALCRAIKLDPSTNPIPVVRLGQPSDALELEADAYLARPQSRSAMLEAFAQAQADRAEAQGQGA